jgi:CheY-like chemotaxis protein/DNA-binding MarR family transcriptional regulator
VQRSQSNMPLGHSVSGHHLQNRLARTAAKAPFRCDILFLSEDQDVIQQADFARPGFNIIRAYNASEAKQLFADNPEIAVVIIDLESAGTDGGNLTASLQSEQPGRDWVEYVILSGSNAPDISPALEALAPGVLSKPLCPGELLAAVTEGYNSSRLRRLNHEERHAFEAPIAEFQMRVSAATAQLLAHLKGTHLATAASVQPAKDGKDAARHLRALINEERMRARLRERVFGALAHNHANWMLLLVLSEAFQAGQEVTIKSTAYNAGLPLSSALRRLNEMCLEGLAARREDPSDARRSFVSLTPQGQSYFVHYEAELSRMGKAVAAS